MLVDQYGNSYKYAKSAERYSPSRPWQPVKMEDIDKLVPKFDRQTLVSASRRLYLNEGVLLGAIQQKAMYAVGRSWLAQSGSKNTDFKRLAEEKLNEEWYAVCDVRGGLNNFQTSLYQISCAVDRDGEAFILLTENENGYPRIQLVPCHRIESPNGIPEGKIKKGKYKGYSLRDGIIYAKSRPIAYCFNNEDGEFVEYIEAKDMIHLYDPSWMEQGRGLPVFTHALNDLRDALQSHEWERWAQLMLSSIGLIETNPMGMPDTTDNAAFLEEPSCSTQQQGIKAESMWGGQVRYFASNTGSKLETIKNDRPGDMWESFQDRIYRKALAGVNWPTSMCWKSTGQGTAERADLGKAQRAVEDRQDLLLYAAKRMVTFAIAKFINRGDLPYDEHWYKVSFTYPKKLTIDDGRVTKELIEMWKAGHLNAQDILGYLGKTPESHMDERMQYLVMQKLKQIEYNKLLPEGHKIEDREIAMLNPNEQSEQNLTTN